MSLFFLKEKELKTIYLDLDGVCTTFITSCIEANNLDPVETMKTWKEKHRGVFSAFKVFGIKNSDFWKNVEQQGEEFWSEMGTYSWFKELYDELSKKGKVYFLTSPSQSPNSLSGKLKWLQRHFDQSFKDYIITPNKDLLACSKNCYLIDDYPENVEKFIAAGGTGILFPQFWNTKEEVEDKVSYVLDLID